MQSSVYREAFGCLAVFQNSPHGRLVNHMAEYACYISVFTMWNSFITHLTPIRRGDRLPSGSIKLTVREVQKMRECA